jgi:hypothetical protein
MMILHRFLMGSITVRTMTGYEREWKTWKEFVARKSLRADADPYMRNQSDQTKVLMVCQTKVLMGRQKREGPYRNNGGYTEAFRTGYGGHSVDECRSYRSGPEGL